MRSADLSAAHRMVRQRLQARPYALIRLPPEMNGLAAVEPRTDQVLSMDFYHCPYGDDAALGVRQQQGSAKKVVAILIQIVALHSAPH